ncbi:hypothetical protein SESBI_21611 [Sesbania bispinosa]|nr:hypothetical protein SESBI_21611 [Sesbania bispinosa]
MGQQVRWPNSHLNLRSAKSKGKRVLMMGSKEAALHGRSGSHLCSWRWRHGGAQGSCAEEVARISGGS